MALDGIAMHAVTVELQCLLNSRIVKVYQPAGRDIILHCRQPGENLPVLLSSDVQNARVHLAAVLPQNPPQPPAFCMLLRKYLEKGRITAVEQPALERILKIQIENVGEGGAVTSYTLIIEAMGRHSNIILLNELGVIIDALVRVDSRINRHREILPRLDYVAPPSQDKVFLWDISWQSFLHRLAPASPKARLARLLLNNIGGIGPLTANEITHRAGFDINMTRQELSEEGLEILYEATVKLAQEIREKQFMPEILTASGGGLEDVSAIALTHQPLSKRQKFTSISRALEIYYTQKANQHRLTSLKANLSRVIAVHFKRTKRKLAAQRRALDLAENADEYKILGELVTANLYKIEKGMQAISVPNFYDPDQKLITIPLDPSLSPSKNAQAFFNKYNKAKKTKVAGLRQYNRSLQEHNYLDQVQTTVDLAQDENDIEDIQKELKEQGYLKARRTERRQTAPQSSAMRFKSKEGYDIYVGRNNNQNDHVTFRIGRPQDMWLHAQQIPGSHVIIRSQGQDIPAQTLREAAALAAYYSKAREGENVPIDYTLRKHVRKPKGAKPGMVIYQNHSTVYVTPDPENLAALEAVKTI